MERIDDLKNKLLEAYEKIEELENKLCKEDDAKLVFENMEKIIASKHIVEFAQLKVEIAKSTDCSIDDADRIIRNKINFISNCTDTSKKYNAFNIADMYKEFLDGQIWFYKEKMGTNSKPSYDVMLPEWGIEFWK